MAEENVKVAVRVRPFNKREKARKAKCCVDMKGNQTIVQNPEQPNDEPKNFAFDHSYWSYDGGKERSDGYWEPDTSHPRGSQYCDQSKCFNDLGVGILKNAWGGYNSTLFAYGQTGSGKSYSVVGYGINKGIVPLFCEKLFTEIEEKRGEGSFEVNFSMLEIYNEIVRDLLNPKGNKKRGLKVRQHKKKGFYAEKLSIVPVDSYAAINAKMEEGTTNRTIAATNMNETSSRAHTIVAITFVQKKKNAAGQEMAKSSVNNLVDLAGSERVANTGATGDRLKEGAAINMSLTSLGNCIAALADNSGGGKKVRVPYRDSVLTKLLMNALGGNSKTTMIAAISPADINYAESLSTLRYADRAKQIKTKAFVNEDPTEKLIRELQEENEKLKASLKGGGKGGVVLSSSGGAASSKEIEEMKAELDENDREMEEMKKTYEERLKQAQEAQAVTGVKSTAEIQKQKAKYPHLYNLNMDPQLSGTLVHIIKSGKYKIGNQKGTKSDIVLRGPSMLEQHAVLKSSKDHKEVVIQKGNDKARILVNGIPITDKMDVHHNDRILFGTTQLYVFSNPMEAKETSSEGVEPITWDMAQEEIAANSGFNMSNDENQSADELKLQEELVEVMPAVEEANSISESLDKMCKFEMILVPRDLVGLPGTSSVVYVRLRNFKNGMTYEWPKDKFMNRFIKMQELYEDVEEGEVDLAKLKDSADPFTEPIDMPVRIGSCSVYLKSLAYILDMKSQLEITDFRGNEIGLLNVEIIPCDKQGKEYTANSEVWVDNPKDLIGREFYFVFKIVNAYGIAPRFTDVRCKYTFFKDPEYIETDKAKDVGNPAFHHKRTYSFKPINLESLEYLMEGRILVELWGVQMPIMRSQRDNRNTGAMLAADVLSKGTVSAANNNQKHLDVSQMKSNMEAAVLRKRQEKMDDKVKCLREMVVFGEQKGVKDVPLSYIKGVLNAPTSEVMEKWSQMYGDHRSNGLRAAHSAGSNPNRITKSSTCVVQ